MIRQRATLLALALVVADASAADAQGRRQQQAEPQRPPPPSNLIEGGARVVDGEALQIGDARVLLFGIDAPELDQTCTRDGESWPCGMASAQALAELIGGREVTCKVESVDYNGRALSTCRLSDGSEINRAQVAAGWAAAYRRISRRYIPDEDAAKAGLLGIWGSGGGAGPSAE
jgi:endonuclease YncB( thermonuclease family)